jgi:hypothetical protein
MDAVVDRRADQSDAPAEPAPSPALVRPTRDEVEAAVRDPDCLDGR